MSQTCSFCGRQVKDLLKHLDKSKECGREYDTRLVVEMETEKNNELARNLDEAKRLSRERHSK